MKILILISSLVFIVFLVIHIYKNWGKYRIIKIENKYYIQRYGIEKYDIKTGTYFVVPVRSKIYGWMNACYDKNFFEDTTKDIIYKKFEDAEKHLKTLIESEKNYVPVGNTKKIIKTYN